ncbi:probable transcription factor At3g04930 [Gastrolobium bilobum]|uniref:probable transcription factor At3g04930 n=1 Tax=Gastrolobium bilobum TaxID=150636 RepID=UPI002AB12F76|nr:probable transcription factor At3g04930 [Gastrolobium bilobum]
MSGVSLKMLSPLVSWILSPSSSSSSSSEEESLDIITDESDYENDNIIENDKVEDDEKDHNDNAEDDENDHFLSSCDVHDTIPLALPVPNGSPAVTVAFPGAITATPMVTRSKRQRTTNYSGTVRQYQRLWTKDDEMELLKGYLDYINQNRRATTSLQNDVASLYDHLKPKLNVDFNRNQLVEKLRRLKRKHKMALDKGKEVPFKNLHEQTIFEISHRIWGNDIDTDCLNGDESPIPESHVKVKTEQVDNCDEIDNRVPKRSRLSTDDLNRTNDQNNGDTDTTSSIQGFIEETMTSCFSPLLKELLDDAREGTLGELAPIPMPLCPGEEGNEQRRKRRILELEVYLNRLELLQDQIKARLEELRSS